ncbi:GtrA family protein [Sutcliffiella halmapala]
MIGRVNNSFIRFLLVGVINTIVGLAAMYLLLNVFDLGYWISTFTGNSIGAIVSYLLNKSFTFKSNARHFHSFLKFILVIVSCYIISYRVSLFLTKIVLTNVGYNHTSLEHNIAILVGTGLYTILNYLGQKYIVFR